MATKKVKKKKLDPIPKINRRLFRLWSEAVRENAGHQCAYCGIKRGDINENEKKTKIDAHHFYSRDVKDSPLKWDIRNGIAVCPLHHKFSSDFSAHRTEIIFYEWVRNNYPDQHSFVLENYTVRVDLQNRKVLKEIEERLLKGEALNLDELVAIETDHPRQSRQNNQPKKDLEEDLDLFA